MSNRIRRGLFAAAGLIGALVAQPARADGDIEKPPEVPPEVCAAKTACPTLTGPCYGYYATKWRVLPGCCVSPAPAAPAPERPTEIPPASRLRAAATQKPAAKPEAPPVSLPAPANADPEPLPVIKPLSAKVVVLPPAPRPEPPVSAPDVVIPPSLSPAPSPKADPSANRPATAEVVPDTSKLRK